MRYRDYITDNLPRDPGDAEDIEIIGVDAWGDSAVDLVCRLKIVPPIQQWTMRREFLKRLKKAYDAHGIEIAHVDEVLAARFDRGDRAGDLAGHERLPAPGRFVVKQNAVHREKAVGLSIVPGDTVAVGLRRRIG